MIFGVQVFDHNLPSPGFGLVAFALIVGVFLLSRQTGEEQARGGGGGGEGRRVGRGMKHRCHRCGRDFQPEQVELLGNGNVRQWIDERCPGCGWELDWGSPNKPGGSSGSW